MKASGKAKIIKVHTPLPKEVVPTRLKFQNGDLISTSKAKFVRFKQKKGIGALVATEDQVYHGLINANNELTDSYICVRNKDTNKVQIIPINHATLKSDLYYDVEKTEEVLKSDTDWILKRKAALKEFGGRKSLRAITASEKFKVDVDAFKDELDATINNLNVTANSEMPNLEDNYKFLRPKFNKDATKIENVYSITDIMPVDLLDRLEEEAHALLNANIEEIPLQSEYLISVLKDLQTANSPEHTKLDAKVIIYMDCLYNLVRNRAVSLRKVELSYISEKIENYVRVEFSDPKTPFVRSKFSKEKAICYYIVLALIITRKYKIDVNHLMQDLQLKRKTLLQYAKIVSAVPRKTLLQLELPSKILPLTSTYKKRPQK